MPERDGEGILSDINPALRKERHGLILGVTVIPRASKNEVIGLRNERLIVKVTSAPEKGKANEAVLRLIAGYLGLSFSDLSIIRGHFSHKKDILLHRSP